MLLNSPRYSTGALGFMSHVSRWLGPPAWKIRMTLRFSVSAVFAVASSRSKSASNGPPKKTAPARRNERRFMTGPFGNSVVITLRVMKPHHAERDDYTPYHF